MNNCVWNVRRDGSSDEWMKPIRQSDDGEERECLMEETCEDVECERRVRFQSVQKEKNSI